MGFIYRFYKAEESVPVHWPKHAKNLFWDETEKDSESGVTECCLCSNRKLKLVCKMQLEKNRLGGRLMKNCSIAAFGQKAMALDF